MKHSEDDPLDLDRVDREIRIEKLRQEANELSGGNMIQGGSGDCPPEIMEQFLEQVVAFENGPRTTHIDSLAKAGLILPPPEELSDEQLSTKLWGMIHGLARLHVFLYCTNHLSDRELYTDLRREGLPDEVPDMSFDPNGAWHHDVLGSGSEEHTYLYLKYYADEEWRRDWLASFPDYQLPEHEDPPYDRDRLLPKREDLL